MLFPCSPSLFTFISNLQVLTQLKKVNFSRNGYEVSFDANGDPVARYELVNWQKSESGSIKFVTVGQYDESLPVGQKFQINRNITWVDGGTQVRNTKAILLHKYGDLVGSDMCTLKEFLFTVIVPPITTEPACNQ